MLNPYITFPFLTLPSFLNFLWPHIPRQDFKNFLYREYTGKNVRNGPKKAAFLLLISKTLEKGLDFIHQICLLSKCYHLDFSYFEMFSKSFKQVYLQKSSWICFSFFIYRF